MSRGSYVFKAILADQAERYHEMKDYINEIVMMNVELTDEERSLLSAAYRNLSAARRASLRVISSMESERIETVNKMLIVHEYRVHVESELRSICYEIINLIDDHLLSLASTIPSKVFYYKMKGDYYRYMAELLRGPERNEAANNSLNSYKAGVELALLQLPTTHPDRLAIVVNFTVFIYEILHSPDEARKMTKVALDDALCDLHTLPNDKYMDTTLMIQMLKENLKLWLTEVSGDGQYKDDAEVTGY